MKNGIRVTVFMASLSFIVGAYWLHSIDPKQVRFNKISPQNISCNYGEKNISIDPSRKQLLWGNEVRLDSFFKNDCKQHYRLVFKDGNDTESSFEEGRNYNSEMIPNEPRKRIPTILAGLGLVAIVFSFGTWAAKT